MSNESNARPPFDSFAAFWPYYVGAHTHPTCRLFHYCGTVLGLGVAAYAFAVGPWWLVVLAPLCGYFFSWLAHFTIERNQPATFQFPVYSFLADFKMLWLGLTGRMEAEVERHTE